MKKETKKELLSYLIIIVIVILIKTFIVTPIRVNGSSMSSTLENKEIMILNETKYYFNEIQRFDIVVVKYKDTKLIKRVIGLPGETLYYQDNKLYIDDNVVEEDYLKEETTDFTLDKFKYKDNIIPQDCYFIMGDNRDDSLDSRYIGCVSKKSIMGNAKTVIFPFDKIRTVK